MTNKEFFTAIASIETIDSELRAFATDAIAKIDNANAKKRATKTKTQVENEKIEQIIVAYLLSNPKSVASGIATALGISTQKASALCRALVNVRVLKQGETKVKGGTVKNYSVVANTEDEGEE